MGYVMMIKFIVWSPSATVVQQCLPWPQQTQYDSPHSHSPPEYQFYGQCLDMMLASRAVTIVNTIAAYIGVTVTFLHWHAAVLCMGAKNCVNCRWFASTHYHHRATMFRTMNTSGSISRIIPNNEYHNTIQTDDSRKALKYADIGKSSAVSMSCCAHQQTPAQRERGNSISSPRAHHCPADMERNWHRSGGAAMGMVK